MAHGSRHPRNLSTGATGAGEHPAGGGAYWFSFPRNAGKSNGEKGSQPDTKTPDGIGAATRSNAGLCETAHRAIVIPATGIAIQPTGHGEGGYHGILELYVTAQLAQGIQRIYRTETECFRGFTVRSCVDIIRCSNIFIDIIHQGALRYVKIRLFGC